MSEPTEGRVVKIVAGQGVGPGGVGPGGADLSAGDPVRGPGGGVVGGVDLVTGTSGVSPTRVVVASNGGAGSTGHSEEYFSAAPLLVFDLRGNLGRAKIDFISMNSPRGTSMSFSGFF
ncbi:hypothetical protein ACWEOE_07920 [Amycolatopsis sp. NPDC004368]